MKRVRRAGKAAKRRARVGSAGTAQGRLCPPYEFRLKPALGVQRTETIIVLSSNKETTTLMSDPLGARSA